MTATHAPDAWPLFLDVEMLEAYLRMDYRTISAICPVQPLDFGNRVLRYHREHIDAWARTIPTRLLRTKKTANTAVPAAPVTAADVPESAEQRRQDSLARVRARSEKTHGRRHPPVH